MEKKYLSKFQSPRDDSKVEGVQMGIWEALEYMDTMVDDSDPDTNFTQVAHALQTAEAVRKKMAKRRVVSGVWSNSRSWKDSCN
jgi:hypothetical protein